MNRRSNKILRELILGNRQNILELVTKYNLQERTIRADIKDLNMILSILVYTLFSRMFDLMQPPVVKHSIAVA